MIEWNLENLTYFRTRIRQLLKNEILPFQLAQLETEIDLERARYQELLKELRRNERRVKELLTQVDEEQAKVLSLNDSLSKSTDRMRIYKSQIESAESSAAHGLSFLVLKLLISNLFFSFNTCSSSRTRTRRCRKPC